MKLIADLHIHSRYSRATSRQLIPEEIEYWAKIKGLALVGSGDFTHPGWRAELKEKLEPAEAGLYRLKEEYQIKERVLPPEPAPVRFVISGEISTIYKKKGRVRKLHHLILFPSLELAEKLSRKLEQIGNLASDGRPILGIDSKYLLEMVLELGEGAVFIPAHIWTPWFSLFGSRSGFDDIEECFEDLAGEIFALETGLSSDPKMNWRLSRLDQFSLVSNSDAHSPKNLAREANMFNCELDYFKIIESLKQPEKGYLGTIEFFPEEGKYHFDGHRKCQIRLAPEETIKLKGICPVCGKPLTVGVMHRVEELADRKEPKKPERAPGYKSLIPLPEVISEILQIGSQSKKTESEYFRLISRLGSELKILLDLPVQEIEREFSLLGLAVKRMREGEVIVEEGYDGEYGRIRVFEEEELAQLLSGQGRFFELAEKPRKKPEAQKPLKISEAEASTSPPELFSFARKDSQKGLELTPEQLRAIRYSGRVLLVKAGPGTGKTFVLTERIAFLIESKKAQPSQILALTFTNQAGREMQARLQARLREKADDIFIGTFHRFCLKLLREIKGEDYSVLDDSAQRVLVRELFPDLSERRLAQGLNLLHQAKISLLSPEEVKADSSFPAWFFSFYLAYQSRLKKEGLWDFADLIFELVKLLEQKDFSRQVLERFRYIFVDEFQDLNYAQYQLVCRLAGKENHLFAVGDPDQAIYGFRGASPEYFYKLQKDFPEAEVVELTHSFRSSDQILKASCQVLGEKRGFRSDKPGARLKIVELASERAEAEFVVHEIEKLVGGFGFFSFDSARVESSAGQVQGFGDFAVLFRSSEQIPALKTAFSRSGLPFQIASESPLESKFFRTSLWILEMLIYENTPLVLQMALRELFPQQASFPPRKQELASWLEKNSEPEAKRLLELLQNFRFLSPVQLCEQIYSLIPAQSEEETEEKEMVKNLVVELVRRQSQAGVITTPEQMLENLKLAGSQDFYHPQADRVSLLTIHSAKGLEFEVVFLVGCEEGLLPYFTARTEKELAEEKRLFYVALTRARNLIYLTRAKKRNFRKKPAQLEPSRFLKAIEKELREELKPLPGAVKPRVQQMELF